MGVVMHLRYLLLWCYSVLLGNGSLRFDEFLDKFFESFFDKSFDQFFLMNSFDNFFFHKNLTNSLTNVLTPFFDKILVVTNMIFSCLESKITNVRNKLDGKLGKLDKKCTKCSTAHWMACWWWCNLVWRPGPESN